MKKSTPIWLTIAIALIAFVAGLFIDRHYLAPTMNVDNDQKVDALLKLIAQEYVDTVNLDRLIEKSIPEILNNLDPHSTYYDAKSPKVTAEVLDGAVPDIGIAIIIFNDTIHVESTLPGGPSDIAGIIPGDRIITIDGQPATIKTPTMTEVVRLLSGPDSTQLTLGVRRHGQPKSLEFTVTRNKYRESSVDSYFMLDRNNGYVKVNQFSQSTLQDFIKALTKLQSEGAKRFMIDLRGNGGGYVEVAVRMANEFLSSGEPIVSMHSRNKQYESQYSSNGKGAFQNVEIAVLIDEYSASASEIFAGALQDNDRGLIVGRRSYGKGLVQKDFTLPDSSYIRLAIARYHTPSGRCIQKDYQQATSNYDNELLERFKHGELYNSDSIKIDKSKMFTTRHGRTVYGSGGIIPDIFVARDLDGINGYFIDVENAGLLQRFAFTYCEKNRASLNQMSDYKQFLRTTPIDNAIIKEFADFATENGVAPRWYYINQARDVILTRLKALIARDIFGPHAYFYILNRNDKTVQVALRALNRYKATFPIND